jgi:nitrogen regulatory protein PII-like uncharacterized protein
MFFFLQNHRTRGQNRFFPEEEEGGKVTQIMYTHVITCKIIKKYKKRKATDYKGLRRL